jgi:hypothetical protein
MTFLFGTTILIIFWTIIYVINTFLLEFKLTSAIYAKFLSKNGISINLLQIKWYTVRCNRLFIRLSNIKANFLKHWFNFGVLIGLLGQWFSILFLSYTLFTYFRSNNKLTASSSSKIFNEQQILVPVVCINFYYFYIEIIII